ncbi:nitrilase-related carbon-nitrogen hydrolase [Microbulbifer hydrolyticus]|uniref:Hydrolase n=1 Tax=Microbulbifer hydrolyticus TaxID=48074 RepID=A0A6P1TBE5_9GAMM|nr:nitrilase-related carbon-nitrogen hydrolase [Microbulbifer hydrolyticus]MBB5210146.1 putative amidohydrolase [Microbulbifer hydrolyticus]QHQ39337.1 hydrolase [Microbulbifer hydrolyticus]
MSNRTIRVAAAQFHVGTDVDTNLATVLRMLDEAAAVSPDLIVLPEFCNHLSWYDSREHCAAVSVTLDGPFLSAVVEKVRALAVHVVINCTVNRENDTITGSSLLYSPEGELLADNTKQIYIGHENDFLEPAHEPGPVVETPLGRLGLYACMDGVINEPPRTLALRGAQILCNSLNSFASDEGSLHVPVRAPENRVFIVAANKVGPLVPEPILVPVSEATGIPLKFLNGAGESQIVAPDGSVLACASADREEVIFADIEPCAADRKRRPDGTDVIASRRPALYRAISEDPAGQAYPAWKGAEELAASVIDPLTGGRDGLREAVSLAVEAFGGGAKLVAVPPLLDAETIAADLPAALDFAGEVVETLRQCCGAEGFIATALPMRGDDAAPRYCALLIGVDGVRLCQGQVHRSERFAWSEPVDELQTLELPFGRVAVVTSDDSIYPETFRLLAMAGVDTAVVPLEPLEAWELRTGLLERSAENRINLLAAAIGSPLGQGFATALQRDFTVLTPWEARPFDGLLSQPELYCLPVGDKRLAVTLYPAAAANKEVSRNTDLVTNRPWKLCGPITAR